MLHYLSSPPPAVGSAVRIADDVYWTRVPLPLPLGHINVWLLRDGEGWAIVDSGFYTVENVAVWQELLSSFMRGFRITRVFATHMHADHVGMAGWLVKVGRCDLWMTRSEYLSYRVTALLPTMPLQPEVTAFYRRAGWSADSMTQLETSHGAMARYVSPPPGSYRRLRDSDTLQIGERRWTVITGSGHSPEHACLYCPDLSLLISGDQVLPRISSNVSVLPCEPDALPVAEWLASINKLRRRIPDDVLVLPSHQEPFHGLHSRLDALQRSQCDALKNLSLAIATAQRVEDLLPQLYKRDFAANPAMQLLATGEVVGGLNHLLHTGLAERRYDTDGVAWYQTARCA